MAIPEVCSQPRHVIVPTHTFARSGRSECDFVYFAYLVLHVKPFIHIYVYVCTSSDQYPARSVNFFSSSFLSSDGSDIGSIKCRAFTVDVSNVRIF